MSGEKKKNVTSDTTADQDQKTKNVTSDTTTGQDQPSTVNPSDSVRVEKEVEMCEMSDTDSEVESLCVCCTLCRYISITKCALLL